MEVKCSNGFLVKEGDMRYRRDFHAPAFAEDMWCGKCNKTIHVEQESIFKHRERPGAGLKCFICGKLLRVVDWGK